MRPCRPCLTNIKIMDWVDLLWHVAGFAAPALVLAPAMVLIGQVFGKKSAPTLSWPAQAAINLIVCLGVLAVGLVLTGHDGRMATYAALVLASASTQWVLGVWGR